MEAVCLPLGSRTLQCLFSRTRVSCPIVAPRHSCSASSAIVCPGLLLFFISCFLLAPRCPAARNRSESNASNSGGRGRSDSSASTSSAVGRARVASIADVLRMRVVPNPDLTVPAYTVGLWRDVVLIEVDVDRPNGSVKTPAEVLAEILPALTSAAGDRTRFLEFLEVSKTLAIPDAGLPKAPLPGAHPGVSSVPSTFRQLSQL